MGATEQARKNVHGYLWTQKVDVSKAPFKVTFLVIDYDIHDEVHNHS